MKNGAIFDEKPGEGGTLPGPRGGPTIQQDILRIGTILGKKTKLQLN